MITLSNGVEIQRTPNDDIAYNTMVLDADNRGCTACHGQDLNNVLKNLSLATDHFEITTSGDMPLRVQSCIACHELCTGFGSTRAIIHGIHLAEDSTFQGNCMSCHEVDADGNMQLWERAKYNLLHGIITMDANEGTLTYDQTTCIPAEDMFSINWHNSDQDLWRSPSFGFEASDSGYTLENWPIRVTGEVTNPIDTTMAELIKEAEAEGAIVTKPLKLHCKFGYGDGQISQVNMTGVSLRWLLEKAGVNPDWTTAYCYDIAGEDGYLYSYFDQARLNAHDALLVYQMDGKDVPVSNGYPVLLMVPGSNTGHSIKQFSTINIAIDDKAISAGDGKTDANGEFFCNPDVGIFYTADGQIIEAGKPYTFEGYCDAFIHDDLATVEVSLDLGKTWNVAQIENYDVERWVYWRFTFTPETEGSYVIMVRGTTEGGLVTREPYTLMVTAKY